MTLGCLLYGSFGAGLDIKFKISDTSLTLGISQYVSGETLGLSGKQDYETPSLVNFFYVKFRLGSEILSEVIQMNSVLPRWDGLTAFFSLYGWAVSFKVNG